MRSLCVCGKSASAAASMVSSGIGPIAEDQRLTQIIRHAPSDATPSEMDVERASTKLSSVVLHPGPEEPVADLEDPEDHELDEERFPKEKEVFVPRIEIIGPMACATSPMPSAASTYRAEAAQAAQAAEQVQRLRFAATSLTSGPMTDHVSSADSAALTEPMINFGASRTTTDVQSLVSAAADVPAPVQQPVEETDAEGEAAVKRTEEQTGKAVGTVVQEPVPATGMCEGLSDMTPAEVPMDRCSMVSSGIGPIAEDQRLTQIIRHAPSDATPSEMEVERASTILSAVVLHPGPEEPVADLEDPEDHELDEQRFPKEKEVFV